MRNLRRIIVIMVMVCLMIGGSGCMGIFDSTKSEVRIAKKVLKGMKHSARFRDQINHMVTAKEVIDTLNQYRNY